MKNTLIKSFLPLAVLLSFLVTSPGIQAQEAHRLESNSFVGVFRVAGPFHEASLDPDDYSDLLEIEFIEAEGHFGIETDNIKTDLARAGTNNYPTW